MRMRSARGRKRSSVGQGLEMHWGGESRGSGSFGSPWWGRELQLVTSGGLWVRASRGVSGDGAELLAVLGQGGGWLCPACHRGDQGLECIRAPVTPLDLAPRGCETFLSRSSGSRGRSLPSRAPWLPPAVTGGRRRPIPPVSFPSAPAGLGKSGTRGSGELFFPLPAAPAHGSPSG